MTALEEAVIFLLKRIETTTLSVVCRENAKFHRLHIEENMETPAEYFQKHRTALVTAIGMELRDGSFVSREPDLPPVVQRK